MRFTDNRRFMRRFQWIAAVVAVLGLAGIVSAKKARISRVSSTARTASVALEQGWLDINNFKMPVSNYGQHGQNKAENRAGGEWPSGSGEFYLFGAGVWVGGTIDNDPFLTITGTDTMYSFKESTTNPLGWSGTGKIEGGDLGSRAILTDPRIVTGYNPAGGTEELSPLTKLFFSTDDDWSRGSPVSILDSYAECDDQDPMRWDTGEGMNSGKDIGWTGDPTVANIAEYGVGVKITQTTYSWNYANNSDIHFATYVIENSRADGKPINNAFVGIVSDPDIGNESTDDMAGFDATRDLGYAYDGDFAEQEFAGVPGFIGYDFLKSPSAEYDIDKNGDGVIDDVAVPINTIDVKDVKKGDEIGLHAYKIFGRLAGDPSTEWESFMVMAGHKFREDQNQTYQPFDLSNTPEDQRFLQTTGPMTLKKGEPVTIVVAMMVAGASGAAGDPITTRVVNLQATSDVAQSIFDNDFLLPVPPAAPAVTVRPGDKKAYISWDDVAETTPDKFYDIASDPTGSLYDPDYKQNDFEGYRVWRSLTARPDDWELLTTLDKVSKTPRMVAVTREAGATASTITYDPIMTEAFHGYGAPWSNHEYLIHVEGGTGSIRIYDVNLNGAEVPPVTAAEGVDWWYEHDDSPPKFEIYNSDMESQSTYFTQTRTLKRFNDGMQIFVGGISLSMTGAKPTSDCIWRVIPAQEEAFGSETGIAHAYIDSPLINGKTYYYAVTAFDFQLSSPRSLESGKSLSQGVVIPRTEPVDLESPYVSTVTHTTGVSDGIVKVTVVDPEAITGNSYKIGFKSDGTWFVTSGPDTVVNNFANQSGGEVGYPIADGMQISVAGPALGIASRVWTSGSRWFDGLYPDYYFMLGDDFAGASITGADYTKVEIRFSATAQQKAARYLRGQPVDQPQYPFSVGTFPGTVWDVTSDPPRQLMVVFVEQLASGIDDHIWNPDNSGTGGREYLFITYRTYDDDETSAVWSEFNDGSGPFDGDLPLMYASWPAARTDEATGNAMTWTEGDILEITPRFVNTVADVFDFTTTARVAKTDATDLSKVMVVPNPFIVRHELMANKENPSLMFTNVPSKCKISIYTLAGDLVDIVNHETSGTSTSGTALWDLRNSNFQRVASGIYLFVVDDLNGEKRVGKFAVVR